MLETKGGRGPTTAPPSGSASWRTLGRSPLFLGGVVLGVLGQAAHVAAGSWLRTRLATGGVRPLFALALDEFHAATAVLALAMMVWAALLRTRFAPWLTAWPPQDGAMRTGTPARTRTRTRRAALAALLAAGALWTAGWCGGRMLFALADDFQSYYFAAAALEQGVDPYDEGALNRIASLEFDAAQQDLWARHGAVWRGRPVRGGVFPYLYPPLSAVLLRPLTRGGYMGAQNVWTALGLVALALLGTLALRIAGRSTAAFVALSGVLLLYQPLAANFEAGQINLLVVLAAWLAFVFDRESHAPAAGAALALAAHLKFSPVVLVLYFVVRGRVRTLAWSAAFGLVLLGATWIGAGPGPTRTFFERVLPAYSSLGRLQVPDDMRPEALVLPNANDPVRAFSLYPAIRVLNQAPTALAGYWAALAGRSAAFALRVVQALLALLWGTTLWRAWRARRARREDGGTLFGAFTCLVLLTGPILWQHHLVWLIPPIVILVAALARGGWPRSATVLGGSGIVLTASAFHYNPLVVTGPGVPWSYTQLAGIVALWAALLLVPDGAVGVPPAASCGNGTTSIDEGGEWIGASPVRSS